MQLNVSTFAKMIRNHALGGRPIGPDDLPEEVHDTISSLVKTVREESMAANLEFQRALYNSLDFCRCIMGGPNVSGSIVASYICTECMTLPDAEFSWYVTTGHGTGSGWPCAVCGSQYFSHHGRLFRMR